MGAPSELERIRDTRALVQLHGESLEAAIVASVAYFDIFACAPHAGEIHRFLLGHRATRGEVELALATNPILARTLGTRDGCWFLAGKDHLAARRRRFARHSAALWPKAKRIAELVERTGLATAGLVTGSLAADNADEHADIDFLFTYPAHRTWTSYAGVRLFAKLPFLGVEKLCANYVLSEAALEIRPQNVFTAWELAKAVPMFGFDVYRRLVLANAWVGRFLPNALPALVEDARDLEARNDPPLARALTSTRAFRALEAAERRRKFERDRRDVGVDMEERVRQGSMDRHSPTRSHFVLSELRYRFSLLGLEAHPFFRELSSATTSLETEMERWPSVAKAKANGAPANGAPANGAPANGAPANGAPANGANGHVLRA